MQRLKQKPFNLPSRRSFCRSYDLQSAGPLASVLKSRSVIRFAGPDSIKFLQGLLTNDVRRFDQKSSETLVTPNLAAAVSPPIYAALLTPQGRFLYDFFLYKPAMEDDKLNRTGSGPGSESDKPFEIFADVDSSVLDELLTSLKRYRLRSKVEIDNVGEELSCWQRFGARLAESSSPLEMEEPDAAGVGWGSEADRTAAASSHGNGDGWRWFNDPRLNCLGFRGIFPVNTTPPLVEADKETEEENYMLWRVENGVAEGSIEIPKGEAIPHEYNMVGLNAISFDKGCYVGQELVARTHHRGVIRKRLLPLRFFNHDGEEMVQKVCPGSEIVDPESGKKVGNVMTAIGSQGLGIVRLEKALKSAGSSSSLGIKGQEDVKVEASKPHWWPNEWSQHIHQHTALA